MRNRLSSPPSIPTVERNAMVAAIQGLSPLQSLPRGWDANGKNLTSWSHLLFWTDVPNSLIHIDSITLKYQMNSWHEQTFDVDGVSKATLSRSFLCGQFDFSHLRNLSHLRSLTLDDLQDTGGFLELNSAYLPCSLEYIMIYCCGFDVHVDLTEIAASFPFLQHLQLQMRMSHTGWGAQHRSCFKQGSVQLVNKLDFTMLPCRLAFLELCCVLFPQDENPALATNAKTTHHIIDLNHLPATLTTFHVSRYPTPGTGAHSSPLVRVRCDAARLPPGLFLKRYQAAQFAGSRRGKPAESSRSEAPLPFFFFEENLVFRDFQLIVASEDDYGG